MVSGRNERMDSLILEGGNYMDEVGFERGVSVVKAGWGGREKRDTVDRSFRMLSLWW